MTSNSTPCDLTLLNALGCARISHTGHNIEARVDACVGACATS